MKSAIEKELTERLLQDEGFRVCALEMLNELPDCHIGTFDDLLDDILIEIFIEKNPIDTEQTD